MSISYTLLEDNHLPQITVLLLDAFQDEPLVSAFGIKRDELSVDIYFQEFLEHTAQQKLSIIAIDEDVGKVVGLNLIEKFRVENTPTGISPTVIPYYDLFQVLGENYDQKMGMNKVLMMDSLAVKEEYRQQGICKELIKQGEALGLKHQFEYSMMYATNDISHKIAKDCGYSEVCEISYDSFKHQGETLLNGIADAHKGAKVFSKSLIDVNEPLRRQHD